jgi:RND family efflux transporter MFP subunit
MISCRTAISAVLALLLVGCDQTPPPVPQARLVRTITVGANASGEVVSLTGHVRARDATNIAFRLDGRIIERPVSVGDVVSAGQVVARLDAQNQLNAQRAAQANLAAAEATYTQASLAFKRQQDLLADGWTPRARFDDARQALETARAQVDAARAQKRIADDQLSYTTLVADAPGTVTAVGAESDEVVRAGQTVVQLALQSGRDAVFDVPEQLLRTGPRDPEVRIALTDDTSLVARGRVREIAPQADPLTRTFQVKVEVLDPPDAMRLGSTVTGSLQLATPPGVEVPASALTQANGGAAVWVVDPGTQTVSLRPVEVARFDPASAVVASGLEAGDVVVTAGVQVLRPGQPVRLMGGAS